jgi:hypothetical protein
MAKIDRVEDLPDWFEIENYRGAENFGAVDWYQHLALRRYLITLQQYQHEAHQKLRESAAATFARYVIHTRETSVDRAQIPSTIANPQTLRDDKKGVAHLTFRHLQDHALNNSDLKVPRKWFADMSERGLTFEVGPTPMDKPLFLTGYPGYVIEQYGTARVDLDYPDAILMEGFKEWLAETRALKGQQQAKKYHRPNFRRWARYGILPYLDLTIWAIETESHIPDRVMAAAVLPRLDFGEGNLRKTIAPLADSLMNDLTELRALASAEATGRLLADSKDVDD